MQRMKQPTIVVMLLYPGGGSSYSKKCTTLVLGRNGVQIYWMPNFWGLVNLLGSKRSAAQGRNRTLPKHRTSWGPAAYQCGTSPSPCPGAQQGGMTRRGLCSPCSGGQQMPQDHTYTSGAHNHQNIRPPWADRAKIKN